MSKEVKINYLIVRWSKEDYQVVAHHGELESKKDHDLELVGTFDLQGLIKENYYSFVFGGGWDDGYDLDGEVYDNSKNLLSETQIMNLAVDFAFENQLCFWTHRNRAPTLCDKPSNEFHNEIQYNVREVIRRAAVTLGWYIMIPAKDLD